MPAVEEYKIDQAALSPPGRSFFSTPEKPPAPIERMTVGTRAARTPATILFGAIPDRGLRCKKPVSLKISREGGSVVAYSPELEEFGYGESLSEALDDFGRTLAELFRSLKCDEERLGEDLLRQLELVREFVETRPGR